MSGSLDLDDETLTALGWGTEERRERELRHYAGPMAAHRAAQSKKHEASRRKTPQRAAKKWALAKDYYQRVTKPKRQAAQAKRRANG